MPTAPGSVTDAAFQRVIDAFKAHSAPLVWEAPETHPKAFRLGQLDEIGVQFLYAFDCPCETNCGALYALTFRRGDTGIVICEQTPDGFVPVFMVPFANWAPHMLEAGIAQALAARASEQ